MAFTLGRCSAVTLALPTLMNINEHGVDMLRLPQTALKDILGMIVVGDTNSHYVTETTLMARPCKTWLEATLTQTEAKRVTHTTVKKTIVMDEIGTLPLM